MVTDQDVASALSRTVNSLVARGATPDTLLAGIPLWLGRVLSGISPSAGQTREQMWETLLREARAMEAAWRRMPGS